MIEYLPGDSASIRAAASHIRRTTADLATARTAARRIEAVTDGAHWRGEAFDVFRAATERKPLVAAIDHAASTMETAAAKLDWFADRFDDNQATIRWCRGRLHALGVDASGRLPDEATAELASEVDRIRRDAERAVGDHRWALAEVAHLFDVLDDEPMYAQPPPSNWDRVRGAADQVGNFVYGIGSGVVKLVVEVATLAFHLNPFMLPFTLQRIWDHRDQIVAILRYAWDNPGEFLLTLGEAMLDLDTLYEHGVARWLGERVPEIVLALLSGGLGTLGSRAAVAVRGVSRVRAADRVLELTGAAHRFRPMRTGNDAVSAAADLGRGGLANRLNRFDADPERLTRVSADGALARTDSALGRLATRLDANRVVEVGRQLPGWINDEIKGFTSLPKRFFEMEHAAAASQSAAHAQRKLDSFLTNGLTGDLGMIDGLLVGSGGISPKAQAAMVGVLGFSTADRIMGTVDVVGQLSAAADARGAVPCGAGS